MEAGMKAWPAFDLLFQAPGRAYALPLRRRPA